MNTFSNYVLMIEIVIADVKFIADTNCTTISQNSNAISILTA